MVLSMDRWKGKVAIVTGASAGIGAAIVRKLVDEGMIVVGLARRLDRMEELGRELTEKGGKFYALKCDMTIESDIQNAFKYVIDNIGSIHVLVNNAGCLSNTSLAEGDTEKWRNVLDVNVLGLSMATREAIGDMRRKGIDGHIIHINSVLGHIVSYNNHIDGLNIYPASKHAVTALAETLRREFNVMKSKIKITSISPGHVPTDILGVGERQDLLEDLKTAASLSPDDVADGVCYVLSTPAGVNVSELTIKPVNELF